MTKLVKIVVLGLLALGISACGGSCKSGDVQDEVVKKVKTMYPNSNPKLKNIEMTDSDSEDKSVQCKADIVGVDEDKLSVEYSAHNRGDKVRVSTSIKSMVGEIRNDVRAIQNEVMARVFTYNINTKTQKAPQDKSWGEWIMEINTDPALVSEQTRNAFKNKWIVSGDGISPKDCNKGETPFVWINPKDGAIYISPSKLAGEGKMEAFCKGLSESYRSGKSNGDKKVPIEKAGIWGF